MINTNENNVQLLNWDKDVTLKNVGEFRIALEKLLECDRSNLILELTEVSYLNSAALGLIADAVLSSSRSDKELVVAGIQPTVGEIFKIVHFNTFMKIFMDIKDAYVYFEGDN